MNGTVWRTETDCEMMIWIWSVSRYLVIHFIKMIMYDSEIAINIRLKIGVNEWWITSQCWLTYYCSFDISFFSGQAPLYFADCCLCTVTYSVERMILIVATWLKFLFAVTTSVPISTSWYLKWRMSLVVEKPNNIVTCDLLFIL